MLTFLQRAGTDFHLAHQNSGREQRPDLFEASVHLLYVDESGCVNDAKQKFFVLAGVCIFERKTHWIEQDLNAIAERFAPNNPYEVELHGSPMRSGREGWKKFPLESRLIGISEALSTGVVKNYPRGVRLFAVVLEKAALVGMDPVSHAFEQISTRFDMFLKRLYIKHSDIQRGLILFDESSTEKRIQTLAREFKYSGHSWGKTNNYAEVPVFLDSRASRLIQLADLVAYAIFRYFEHSDDSFYKLIKGCFDSEGDVQHGLYVHRTP